MLQTLKCCDFSSKFGGDVRKVKLRIRLHRAVVQWHRVVKVRESSWPGARSLDSGPWSISPRLSSNSRFRYFQSILDLCDSCVIVRVFQQSTNELSDGFTSWRDMLHFLRLRPHTVERPDGSNLTVTNINHMVRHYPNIRIIFFGC